MADIHELIEARRDYENLRAQVAQSQREWEQRERGLLAASRLAKEKLGEMEREYRAEAELVFLATGDKKPITGASIRLLPRIDYRPGDAIPWAIGSRQDLLQFDGKGFDRDYKDGLLPSWASRIWVPQVCLATDLEAALSPKPPKLGAEDLLPAGIR